MYIFMQKLIDDELINKKELLCLKSDSLPF